MRTARGIAGARGTNYTTGIDAEGRQTVFVTSGTVEVVLLDGTRSTLTAGQVAIATADGRSQVVDSLDELLEAERAAAEALIELTLRNALEALRDGYPVDGLRNALNAADRLGATIDPNLRNLIREVLLKDEERFAEQADQLEEQNRGASDDDDERTRTREAADARSDEEDDSEGNEDPEDPFDPEDPIDPEDPTDPFRDTLNESQQSRFDRLPEDLQAILRDLDEEDVTNLVLGNDPITGQPFTIFEIRTFLEPLSQLSPDALAFLFDLAGGDGLPNVFLVPSPSDFSAEAFERSLAVWNELTTTTQQDLLAAGAVGLTIDRSVSYLEALAAAYNAQSEDFKKVIREAGYGNDLPLFLNDPDFFALIGALSSLSNEQLAFLQFLEISPRALFDAGVFAFFDLLQNLGALSTEDLMKIIALRPGEEILLGDYGYYSNPNGGGEFTQASTTGADLVGLLNFFATLNEDEQNALLSLELGSVLLATGLETIVEVISDDLISATDRALEIIAFYLSLGIDEQEALRDMRILADASYLGDTLLRPEYLADFIEVYGDLSNQVKRFIDSKLDGQTLLGLLAGAIDAQYFGDPVRDLFGENGLAILIDGLSEVEFGVLLDIDGGRAVVSPDLLGADPATALASVIAFYDGLPETQKQVLRELTIVDGDNVGLFRASQIGLAHLLKEYANLSGSIRVNTRFASDYAASYSVFENESVFFPRDEMPDTGTIFNVRFVSPADLHVGAVRRLSIDSTTLSLETFAVPTGADVYLRAADLIELTSTAFSESVRHIHMAAVTISLTNVNFPGGSAVFLNSQLGGIDGKYPVFGGANPVVGRVNFRANVSYDGNAIMDTMSFDEFGQQVYIGSFANPVNPGNVDSPIAD